MCLQDLHLSLHRQGSLPHEFLDGLIAMPQLRTLTLDQVGLKAGAVGSRPLHTGYVSFKAEVAFLGSWTGSDVALVGLSSYIDAAWLGPGRALTRHGWGRNWDFSGFYWSSGAASEGRLWGC